MAAELPVLSQILSELNQSFHLRDGVWLAARFSLLIVADDNQILPETSAKAANDRLAGVLLVVLPSENTSEGEITVTNPSLKEPVIFDAAAINGPDRAGGCQLRCHGPLIQPQPGSLPRGAARIDQETSKKLVRYSSSTSTSRTPRKSKATPNKKQSRYRSTAL